MRYAKEKVEKLCSFYVSDWHLATMLLPYINKKVDEKVEVIAILETNLKENIKVLLNKLNLKNKEKIDRIDFDKTNAYKYENIVKKIGDKLNNEIVIIVNGNKEYIEATNNNINKVIEKNINKINKKIKIVNCYEVTEFNTNIKEILDEHDKILNTSGEKEKGEVFEGYSDVKINEAK